jgi:hypothetical protein
VVAKVRERLAVSKQKSQAFDVEIFCLRQLSELEVRKQYQIKMSNRSAALENLNDSKAVCRAWENIKENIRISAKESLGLYELRQHKPWFDEEFS